MMGLGYLLLVGGFLAGAFVASTDPLVTNWARFVPAVLGAVAGVALIKKAARLSATADHVLEGNRNILTTSLANIVANLETLQADKERIPPYELRFEIDKLFRDDLMRFADARHALSHLYGLQTYADIMSEFAAGERYLNRVWSASADGYVDEALAYIERALTQFRDARSSFEAIAAGSRGR